MRHFFIIAAVLFSHALASAQSQECNPKLQEHIYNSSRFQLIEPSRPCRTVTGTVRTIQPEADGGRRIQLTLDPGQDELLNKENIATQKGCLVVEIICATTPTQSDAIGPCKDFTNPVPIPKVGDHIRVTGTFIKDVAEHHGWNAIYPVSAIEHI